ncbi:hypothetical protein FHT67_000523 [Paenibacillus sp. BK720]|nr:hypothetical protein [Paenibacillus sp. BK720]
MDDYHRAFIYASEFTEIEAERKAARAQGRK